MELGEIEIIKAMRFPGSSQCLRWVLIWGGRARKGEGRFQSASILYLSVLQMTCGAGRARAASVAHSSGYRIRSPGVVCRGLPIPK